MIGELQVLMVFGAGLLSVFSPCVLPVIPIVVTGTGNDHRLRPVLIASGLAATFIAMGIISSLFGAFLGPVMRHLETVAGVVIIFFGILMIFDISVFKKLSFFQKVGSRSRGALGGFLLGLTLGVVWIPCVGPILSSVLALVATKGALGQGAWMLFVYSLGFSIPILLAGYASQFFRNRLRPLQKNPLVIRIISGSLLVILGYIIMTKGMIVFGSFGI